MNQDTVTYILLFAVALLASIMLFKIGKKIICFILLLLALYCGVQAVLYYLGGSYELPDIEVITKEVDEIELPEEDIELPTISYEEDPNSFGFGLDGIID